MLNECTIKIVEAALNADPNVTTLEKNRFLDLMKSPAKDGGDRLLSIKEAAELLSVHEKSVWRLAREGRLHVIPIGQKCRRVRLSEVENIMKGALFHHEAMHRVSKYEEGQDAKGIDYFLSRLYPASALRPRCRAIGSR